MRTRGKFYLPNEWDYQFGSVPPGKSGYSSSSLWYFWYGGYMRSSSLSWHGITSFILAYIVVLYFSWFYVLYTRICLIITVPNSPGAIKAVVSSSSSITVSWLPPSEPNGQLTKYTLYISAIPDVSSTRRDSVGMRKKTVPADTNKFQVKWKSEI